jgi:hypothetical protein
MDLVGTLQGGSYGLSAGSGKATVSEVNFVNNGTGIVGSVLAIRNVALTDNPGGAIHLVERRRLIGENLTVAGCAEANYCIGTGRIRLTGLAATGTSTGYAVVWGKGIRLAGASIVGGTVGIRDERAPRLYGVALLGNGVDIIAARRPRLVESTCESSLDLLGTPWGVCTDD